MMVDRYYSFAGLEISVRAPDSCMYQQEGKLEEFRVETVKDPHRFEFQIAEELPPPVEHLIVRQPGFLVYQHNDVVIRYTGLVELGWEYAYIRAVHEGKNHTVTLRRDKFPERMDANTVLKTLMAEHLIARNGGFVFHCSFVDRNGKAILFTAPSGTGKSTQAELWKKLRGAEIINGDRAAVRLVDGKLMAEGIPFAGSSEYCKNRSLPVEAIVCLGQAPVTAIREIRGYEAFSKIWEGVSVNTWDREDMERVSEVVQCAAAGLPIFHLPCTPDESAVIALEEALRKQVNV